MRKRAMHLRFDDVDRPDDDDESLTSYNVTDPMNNLNDAMDHVESTKCTTGVREASGDAEVEEATESTKKSTSEETGATEAKASLVVESQRQLTLGEPHGEICDETANSNARDDNDEDALPSSKARRRQLVTYDDFDMFDDSAETPQPQAQPQKKRRNKRGKASRRPEAQAPMPDDFEPSMRKYWAQRYRLFSKFDQGIKMDKGAYNLMCVRMWVYSRGARSFVGNYYMYCGKSYFVDVISTGTCSYSTGYIVFCVVVYALTCMHAHNNNV